VVVVVVVVVVVAVVAFSASFVVDFCAVNYYYLIPKVQIRYKC
jgi:hypothetical protein